MDEFLSAINGIEYQTNYPLAAYTTYRIGGPADVLVLPKTEDEVLRIVKAAKQFDLPIFVLGGGSNILIGDGGIKGVVIHLGGELAKIEPSADGTQIVAYAGASFPKLTHLALTLGWRCALGWCGTPGQVGGALKMNAGTRLGEIGDAVKKVYGASAAGLYEFEKSQIKFNYRKTSFAPDMVLTRAVLTPPQIELDKVDEFLATASELAKKRKATQPKNRSAGSIFKNPPGDFAGRLIEAAGFKGKEVGGAQISTVHANFIVNHGKATADDILQLAQAARDEVQKRFNVLLEYEVKLAGILSNERS